MKPHNIDRIVEESNVMSIIFLFPSDYFNTRKIDETYKKEAACLQQLGFKTSSISLELLEEKSSDIFPLPDSGSQLIYRGWMLSAERYSRLGEIVNHAGAEMSISQAEYLSTHYLPNWYPLLQDLTPETHFMSVDDNLERKLTELGWSKFFVKDYVKSLKTSIGSIIDRPAAIQTLVAEMNKFRGNIEGGICVRKVEDFIPDTERRYFIINGTPFAASLNDEIPAIVKDCANRISSKFFSVDTIDRRDGCKRIVEIGDGQVSGLVGWTVEQFARLWVVP